MKNALFAIPLLAVAGCGTPGQKSEQISDSVPHARGKHLAYTPIVSVHGLSYLDTALFEDLRRNFTDPLTKSEYRFVIDRIEIDVTCEEAAQWTADVNLDTGAKIALDQLDEFYDSEGPSHFDAGLRRAFTKLDGLRRRDPKLREYIKKHGIPAAFQTKAE